MFPIQVSMHRTDTKYRSYRDIRQSKIAQYGPYKQLTGFRSTDLFPHVQVQYRSAGILTLQLILQQQSFKWIVCMIYRNLGTIGIIDLLILPSLQNIREAFFIFFSK